MACEGPAIQIVAFTLLQWTNKWPSEEIVSFDDASATYECKLLAEDFDGEKVFCKAFSQFGPCFIRQSAKSMSHERAQTVGGELGTCSCLELIFCWVGISCSHGASAS